MSPRAARSARALSAAFVATVVAALSHVAGGGTAPGALTLALALALSSMVCIALSGRALSLWRLTVSVGLSQSAFHGLFAIVGDRALLAPQGAHVHSEVSMPDHLTATGHGDSPMWTAHIAAAVVTVIAFRHGERVLTRLLALLLLVVLRRVPTTVTAPVPATAAPVPAAPAPLPLRLRAIGAHRLRGPPIFV